MVLTIFALMAESQSLNKLVITLELKQTSQSLVFLPNQFLTNGSKKTPCSSKTDTLATLKLLMSTTYKQLAPELFILITKLLNIKFWKNLNN